jgi:hypothetical protein
MKISCWSLVLVFACALASIAGNAGAASAAAKPHAAAQLAQREITYADLEKRVGKRIIVRTTLGTTRSGVLTKYTSTLVDMKLDGGADLTIPANTIRSLNVPVLPPDPLFPTAGDSSAKKN